MTSAFRGADRMPHIAALDGVRAVAVSLVIAYHFGVPGFGGGFLGVDLFFVLSGFLITTLLLGEHRRTGAINYVEFWMRRARRLLPAVFLLLFVVALWGTTLNAYEKGPLRWDLLGSLFYAANWRFILSGQSYFAEFATASPLRHLWSLGIEEQFYAAWPLIVGLALFLLARGRADGRRLAQLAVVAGVGSALLLAVTYDEADASLAYYSTFSRAHELLIGALGAGILAFRPAMVPWFRRRSEWVIGSALALILAAALFLNDAASSYYYGGSVLFCLVAAMLVVGVVAGHGSPGIVRRVLGLPPIAWLGAISYGVYLWHWPVTIWVTFDNTGLAGPMLFLARVAITLGIASASYYVVERPIRRGRVWRIPLGRLATITGAIVLGGIVGVTSVRATHGWKPPPDFLSSDPVLRVETNPTAWGTIGLVGDSVALSLYPGLRAEASALNASAASAALAGCAIGDSLRIDESDHLVWDTRKCAQSAVDLQREMIATYDPALVIWHDGKDRQGIRYGGKNLEAGSAEWLTVQYADWDRTLERLRARGAYIVILLPPPAEKSDPATCSQPNALAVDDCVRPVLTNGALRQVYLDWANGHPGEVQLVDVTNRLCPDGSQCPPIVDGVNMRRDQIHFSSGGGRLVVQWLLAELPAGVIPAP